MKYLKITGLIAIIFCLTTKAYSQGSVSIHAGPAIPLFEFADGYLLDGGGAAAGPGAGVLFVYNSCTCGVGFFGGIDIIYNGLQKSYKDDMKQFYSYYNMTDITFSRYINVPLSGGVNYSLDFNDKLGVFANAGFTLNFLKVTDEKVLFSGSRATVKTNIATNIGFRAGCGISLNKKFQISVDYLGLGDHTLSGKQTYSSGPFGTEDYNSSLKVDMLTVSLGYGF